MLWLACHNSEINWKTGEVKITRCPEECEKQQRLNEENYGGKSKKKQKKNKEKIK